MISFSEQIEVIVTQQNEAHIHVFTLGNFKIHRHAESVPAKEWGRDITTQLFQFLVTARHRNGLHKEQIVDRIWEDMDSKSGEQNFKVALHGINKVLEPQRKSRAEPKYIIRQGVTYQLDTDNIWIDGDAMERYIAIGNRAMGDDTDAAIKAYGLAIDLHKGVYLPNRLFIDWSSDERERLQVLVLGAIVNLSELLLESNPMESIRLAQKALLIDSAWEDAYRIQMQAYYKRGNRPMAIKTYNKCVQILDEEFGIDPLPETKQLLSLIKAG